jgi:hypothetical protein
VALEALDRDDGGFVHFIGHNQTFADFARCSFCCLFSHFLFL